MHVALVQMNSASGEVETNRQAAIRWICSAQEQGAQLVLLPETFTTGYNVADRLSEVAEPIPGPTTEMLADVAQEREVHIYGSLIESSATGYHNTGVLISPSGEILAAYRKVHLFATEKEVFVPGDRPAVVQTELGRFGLTICMDLLFPEYIRGLVLSGAQYILNTTDWLRWGPIDQWGWCHEQPVAVARTRALENTVGLAMACQWGSEGEFVKFGHSCMVSPSGMVLAGLREGEGAVVHELSLEGVENWRKIGTYLEDRKVHRDLYRQMLDLE
ncbi:MAG: carbon-nitrogen hydrolase family protein [Candidatus Bipolaricaulota bacterium]